MRGERRKVILSDEDMLIENVIDDETFKRLESLADVFKELPTSESEMLQHIKDADALVIDGGFPITSRIIEAADRLKIIARDGVGYDNVDVAAATKRKILVTNVPGVTAEPVAEHTLLLMLAVARRIVMADSSVRMNRWNEFHHKPCFELGGKTLGIIGLGSIGACVAQKAKSAFNMTILAFDPHIKEDKFEKLGVRRVSLNQLLRESDMVTIHVPLGAETKRLIGEPELSLMKKSAVLINTSRGAVIDESSLIDALRMKKIAAAALDVFSVEPVESSNPLLGLDNVTLTPHIGGCTWELSRKLWLASADAVMRVLRGELPQSPANVVNKEVIAQLSE